MTKPDIEDFVRKAEEIYATHLRSVLEPEHMDKYVAIEPESGDYFLGTTLAEATQAARRSYADRWTHALRVGHRAALHFGTHIR